MVSVLEEHRHGLETGDVVMITEVEGMTEVGREGGREGEAQRSEIGHNHTN